MLAALALVALGVPRIVDLAGQGSRARDVAYGADTLFVALLNAETGQRGYLLTGQEPYLRPYREAEAGIAEAMAAIAAMAEMRPEDDPLRPVLRSLLEVAAAKRAELASALRRYAEAGLEATRELVREGSGLRQMDEIRRLIGEIRAISDVASARAADAAEQRLTWGGLVVACLLALAFAAGLRGQRIGRARETAVAARTRAIVETAPLGIAMFDATLHLMIANHAFAEACGWSGSTPAGRTLTEVLPDHLAPALSAMARQALDHPGELVQADMDGAGPAHERRSWHGLARAVVGTGRARAVVLLLQDITARRDAEAERVLLIHELNHRVKNVIATVQGLATQSWDSADGDGELFLDLFGARLRSLARAHGLLTEAGWAGAALTDVLRVALAPWTGGTESALVVSGEDGKVPRLSPSQVLGLALVLHELATNATKYGALSVPEGRVTLDWAREAEGRIRLTWREQGGPAITEPPAHEGFGSFLIGRAFGSDTEPGEVSRDFTPEGLVAVFRFTPEEA
ncbi:CHASE3 domain-containing protein [Roseomonas sp. HJA6]|uniref:histidine kinase n=1 Tax=Roseomonas alba TaxID=2846776 RepID=A0ABS7AF80_9PROT|nr:CHASE3 domain-containing protein [Neoroseomonas alba]MBW6399950.1 CHASE3 domain-containing protein [Neoroseomonas alba]